MYKIIGSKGDGRFFYYTKLERLFTSAEELASIYTNYNEALEDWFWITSQKFNFKRVFIVVNERSI